jgi:hypothetical protein
MNCLYQTDVNLKKTKLKSIQMKLITLLFSLLLNIIFLPIHLLTPFNLLGSLNFLRSSTSSTLHASPRSFNRHLTGTTPLEAEFFQDLKDRKLTNFSLADAFFIASGIRDERKLNEARRKYAEILSTLKTDLAPYPKDDQKGDYLLQWLHQKVFTSYQPHATDAYSLLKQGTFNCLSSCLLYGILAKDLGYQVTGIAVEHHAFCRFYSKSGGKDVETTTAFGFNPGRELVLDTKIVSVPRTQYRNRTEMSLLEMMGLIYTNHMGLSRAYPSPKDQLLALQKAKLFLPVDPKHDFNQIIKHNMKVSYLEIINQAAQRKNFDEIQTYLEMWQEDDPKADWQDALLFALQQITQKYERARDFREGAQALTNIAQTYTSIATSIYHLRGYLLSLEMQQMLKKGNGQALLDLLNVALEKPNTKQKIQSQITNMMQSNYFASLMNIVIVLINLQEIVLAKQVASLIQKSYPKEPYIQKLKQILK